MLTDSTKNVRLIGTSHIAHASIKKITEEFNKYNPDIICVELDQKRLHALLTNQKPNYSLSGIRQYGLQGYLFAVIGGFIQKKLGNVVGMKPGADMLAAVNIARQNNKPLMLIDQDIEITLRKFSKAFSFKEKMRFMWEIIKSPFTPRIKIDLKSVPEKDMISMLIGQVKTKYPSIYRVLIEDRNQVMAKNIYHIMRNNPDKKILVVIGAGHEEGLLQLIKKEEHKRDKIL